MIHNGASQAFPQLPVMSLQTADEVTTHDISDGRVTIIGAYWILARGTRPPLQHLP